MGKRANFTNIQSSHYVATNGYETSHYRTGYERVIAQYTKLPFAHAAREDGIILDINDKLNIMKIKYKSGKVEAVQFGEDYTKNGGGGFVATQKLTVNNFKKGDRVKRGDIVVYNEDFFTPNIDTKQVDWNIGVMANIAFIESDMTIEDSNTVTQQLADKLVMEPVHERVITLTADTNIRSCVEVGDHVMNTDVLLTFDESKFEDHEISNSADSELIEMLERMNRATPRAQFTGEIVKIECYYKRPLKDMNPSLAKLIRANTSYRNSRAEYAADTSNSFNFNKSQPITDTDRFGNIDLTDDTVVLRFFIKHKVGVRPGDKLIFASSLKSVTTKVLKDQIDTKIGVSVDGFMSSKGMMARIITDPIVMGLAERILGTMQNNIVDMYFNK